MPTKVTRYNLSPGRTLTESKVTVDDEGGSRLYLVKPSGKVKGEGIIATPDAVEVNPRIRHLQNWADLLKDPVGNMSPKRVSRWAMFTGDNHSIIVTSAGVPVAQQRNEGKRPFSEVKPWMDRLSQATDQIVVIARVHSDNSQKNVTIVMMAAAALIGVAALVFAGIAIPELIGRFKG